MCCWDVTLAKRFGDFLHSRRRNSPYDGNSWGCCQFGLLLSSLKGILKWLRCEKAKWIIFNMFSVPFLSLSATLSPFSVKVVAGSTWSKAQISLDSMFVYQANGKVSKCGLKKSLFFVAWIIVPGVNGFKGINCFYSTALLQRIFTPNILAP